MVGRPQPYDSCFVRGSFITDHPPSCLLRHAGWGASIITQIHGYLLLRLHLEAGCAFSPFWSFRSHRNVTKFLCEDLNIFFFALQPRETLKTSRSFQFVLSIKRGTFSQNVKIIGHCPVGEWIYKYLTEKQELKTNIHSNTESQTQYKANRQILFSRYKIYFCTKCMYYTKHIISISVFLACI